MTSSGPQTWRGSFLLTPDLRAYYQETNEAKATEVESVLVSSPNFTLMPIGYMGSSSGSAGVHSAGSLYANVFRESERELADSAHGYKTETTKMNFSSSFYAPANWLGAWF